MAKSKSNSKKKIYNNSNNKNAGSSNIPLSIDNQQINIIESISNNKFLIGLVAIFVNIGSRYIEFNFTHNQELLLRSIAKEVLIFAVTLMMTRDLIIAIILTTIFIILSNFIFNENSKYCLLPKKYKKLESVIDTDGDGEISKEELEKAYKILEKAKLQETNNFKNKLSDKFN